MIKRHEAQVRLRSGMSHREVARQTDVSKRTVTRIAREAAVQVVDHRAEVRRRSIGRPNHVRTFEVSVREILEAVPSLPTLEVLHHLKQSKTRSILALE